MVGPSRGVECLAVDHHRELALAYLFVWVLFRITGKRSLAQITKFDAVLLLIISETTQAALTDQAVVPFSGLWNSA